MADEKVENALAKARNHEKCRRSKAKLLKMRPWGESFTGREVWEVQKMFPEGHVYAEDFRLRDPDDTSTLWYKPLSPWVRWPVKLSHKLKGWMFYN